MLDHFVIWAKRYYVVPELNVHSRSRKVQQTRMINTQWSSSIFINFSLVNILSANSFSSHWIVVSWLEWYVIFKIIDLMLINEVVSLLIHAFANIVFGFITAFNSVLKHWNFNVVYEVPNHCYQNLTLSVSSNNLHLIRSTSVQDFDDLKMFVKIKFNINEDILCVSIIVKHRFIEKLIFDISSASNKQEIIVVDSRTIDIIFPILDVLDFGIKL